MLKSHCDQNYCIAWTLIRLTKKSNNRHPVWYLWKYHPPSLSILHIPPVIPIYFRSHVQIPLPACKWTLCQNQNKLLTINKRTHCSKTTAYFETKLSRDDNTLMLIIRKYFWDLYLVVLIGPPPKIGPNLLMFLMKSSEKSAKQVRNLPTNAYFLSISIREHEEETLFYQRNRPKTLFIGWKPLQMPKNRGLDQ